MPVELFIVVNLILILVVLFLVFDTIKRIKGKFNRGWKILFFAFSMFFILEVIELLDKLRFIEGELVEEVLEAVFLGAIVISVIIINQKVREVTDHHKKKYREK